MGVQRLPGLLTQQNNHQQTEAGLLLCEPEHGSRVLRAEMHMDSWKELSKGATRGEGGEEKRRERNQRSKRGMNKTGREVGYGECRKRVISEGK